MAVIFTYTFAACVPFLILAQTRVQGQSFFAAEKLKNASDPTDVSLPRLSSAQVIHQANTDYIYLVGGFSRAYVSTAKKDLRYSANVTRYQISTGKKEVVGYFPESVYAGSMGTDGKGNFYYFGGYKFDSIYFHKHDLPYIYKFNATSLSATYVNNLPSASLQVSAVSDRNGAIYLLGGNQPGIERIYKLTTSTGAITTMLNRNSTGALRGSAAAWFNGAIYCFGESGYANKTVKFTPTTKNFTVLESQTPLSLEYVSAVNTGKEIYLIGGSNGTFTLAKYDVATDAIIEVTLPNDVRVSRSKQITLSAIIYTPSPRRIYLFGGQSMAGDQVGSDEIAIFSLP